MRPTWDETWMRVADEIAERSRCVRKLGCVIVTAENRIVATGYNGPPAANIDVQVGDSCRLWCPHAMKEPGETAGYADCLSIHAEANALLFCDRRERDGGTLYVTGIPCWDCAKMISNSGVTRVVFRNDDATYRGLDDTMSMLVQSGLDPWIMQ